MTTPLRGSGPELRIGDADREAAVSALGEHYAAGRLTKQEYDERADLAWAARTSSALWPLFADLPRPQAEPSMSRADRPGWTRRGPGRGRPGWWFGGRWAPLLMVVLALVVFTHLPLLLLVVLAWVFLAKSGRHGGRGRGPAGWWSSHPGR